MEVLKKKERQGETPVLVCSKFENKRACCPWFIKFWESKNLLSSNFFQISNVNVHYLACYLLTKTMAVKY
jgi:hypothetical protein